ncbi:MAG: phospholipid carrier-dependent glycosyltransferase [Gemmatimonadetes bacterium]|nr:phospholipid carrier-dependent glycosyltransferase [Gemmatimonadota bacterium]
MSLLVVALGLRLWGSWFGLPHVFHADEGFEVYRAVRLGMGGFDFDRVAKGGYYYLLFLEYGFYFVWLFVTGAISGVSDFAARFVSDPSGFWKIGRATTAVLGTATVAAVWWQGRRIGGARVGWLAAAFLAVSVQHVVNSHYVSVDVPMTLWTFLAILLVVEDTCGRARLRPWWFAAIAAYAVMNKQPAVLLFIPFFLGTWMRHGPRGGEGLWSRRTAIAVGGAALIYTVGNPGIVVNFGLEVSRAFHTILGTPDPDGDYIQAATAIPNLWAFYGRVLRTSQGPAMLALAVAGLGLGLWRRDRAVLLHASFALPFLVLIASVGTSHLYYPRYIVPILPAVALFAALGVEEIIRALRGPRWVAPAVAVGVGVLVIAEPGLRAVQWDQRMTLADTRALAAAWIEENVPHKAAIVLEGSEEDAAQLGVPIGNLKRNMKRMVVRLAESDPGKAKYWSLKLQTASPPLYDLHAVRHHEDWVSVQEYRDAGIHYAVLRRDFFLTGTRLSERLTSPAVATRAAFYEQLLSTPDVELVASFEASPDGHPGYDLEVWKLADLPAEPGAEAGS